MAEDLNTIIRDVACNNIGNKAYNIVSLLGKISKHQDQVVTRHYIQDEYTEEGMYDSNDFVIRYKSVIFSTTDEPEFDIKTITISFKNQEVYRIEGLQVITFNPGDWEDSYQKLFEESLSLR